MQLDLFSAANEAPRYDFSKIRDERFVICSQPWTFRPAGYMTDWTVATDKKTTVFVPHDLEFEGIAGLRSENHERTMSLLNMAFKMAAIEDKEGEPVGLEFLINHCQALVEHGAKDALHNIDGADFEPQRILDALAAIDNPTYASWKVTQVQGVIKDTETPITGHVLLLRVHETGERAFIMGHAKREQAS